MVCADVSPFAGVEKCPDFRGTDTPAAIPLDVSSELASISEKTREIAISKLDNYHFSSPKFISQRACDSFKNELV